MSVTLDRLLFDAAAAADGPNIGAFLRGAGGDVLTSSTVGGKKALDVSIADGVNVEVDLAYTDDSVTAHQGGTWEVSLSAASLAALETINAVQSGTWTVEIGATSLAALETINAVQSGTWTVTATATDLDIRDLTHVSDSVKIGDGTDFMLVNTNGSINAVTSPPDTTVLASAVTVANTATVLPASALSNRKKIEIQNKDNDSVFIGGSGVTTATGIEISKGSTFSMDLGPSALIYAISAAGSAPVRVLEIS